MNHAQRIGRMPLYYKGFTWLFKLIDLLDGVIEW